MMDDKALVEDGEINEDEDVRDDDKEDIPDNFFDDFNNEGFMESLQIVDSLDDANVPEENGNGEEERNTVKRSRERSEGRHKKNKRSRDHEKRSRSRGRKSRNSSPRRKRRVDNAALRRDPNKTKRDLERDRENFAKKKEQKVISKIVETGLVPPGMENEANLNIINNPKETDKKDAKLDENATKSRNQKSSKEKRIDVLKERRRRSRSRSYGRYRSRSRERRIERTRGQQKGFDIISRSRERSRERGRNYDRGSYSPQNRRRRSRSLSDRERWLNERNRSPERKYQGLSGEKKMSFLEEIKMKLNGKASSGGNMVTYPFPKNPVQPKFPDMVPAPVGSSLPQYNQNYPMGDHSVPPLPPSYNEDFFIGNPPAGQMHHNVPPMHLNAMPMHSNLMPMQPVVPPMPPNLAPMPPNIAPMPPNIAPMPPNIAPMHPNLAPMHPAGTHNMQHGGPIQMMPIEERGPPRGENHGVNAYGSSVGPVPAPSSSAEISNKVSELMARISASANSKYNQSKNSPQEKKLTLTDFLRLNKPPEFSSETESLKKKVDVLSRCQDFLKELSGETQYCGKLKVMKTNPIKKVEKNVSPLLRQKPIRFSFNSPMSENSYQDTLNRTLIKLGGVPEVIDLVADEEGPPSPVKRSKVPFEQKSEAPRKFNVSMKMCQTDPVKCEDCEKRKAVQYASIGIQCGESERYNVGVQICEEDIINSRISSTQSLAYLTPAQLLGRSDPVGTRPGGPSAERPGQLSFRDAMSWNRPRDYYDEPGRDYQGPYYGAGRDGGRDPRYPRY